MATFNTAGLKALFTYPFRQANWQNKLLVLGLLSAAGMIIPVVPWLFVWGYLAEIMRRQALEGGEPQLPEWEDWSRLAMDGLRVGLIGLVLTMPVLAVYFGGMGLYFISFIPLMVSEGDVGALGGLPILSMMILMGSMVVAMLLSVVTGVVSPAVMTHTAVKRSFAAALEVREWWNVLRANLGGYVIALAITYTVIYGLMMVGNMLIWTFICCALAPVFFFAITPYLTVITGIVFGQVYREGQLKRAEEPETPAAVEPTEVETPQQAA